MQSRVPGQSNSSAACQLIWAMEAGQEIAQLIEFCFRASLPAEGSEIRLDFPKNSNIRNNTTYKGKN